MKSFSRYVVLILFAVLLASTVSGDITKRSPCCKTSLNGLQPCIRLVEEAPNAEWKNEAGQVLPFPGSDTDPRGFARVLPTATLEDGRTYSNVLETHPRWVDHGNIYGIFKVKLPLGAKYFRAKVGFLQGATGTDGVDFCFYINNILYRVVLDTYDGALKEIEVDVSGYAGQEVEIKLHVYAGDSSGQDWAVWVDPAIWCYPPSLSISASPSSASITQGGQATFQVSISSSYVEEVSLSLTGLPPGATYSFIPPKGSGDFISSLVVTTSSSTPPGTYSLTIRASGGGVTKRKTIRLTVKAAGAFSLNLNPASLTIPQGGSAQSTVVVVPLGGFNQPVTLSLEGVPEGITATLSSTTLSPGGTATITVEVSQDKDPGAYTINVRGVYGDKSYTTTLSIQVVALGFAIALNPSIVPITQGGTGEVQVIVKAMGGFSEIVTLSLLGAPAGVSGSFNPASVAPGSSSTLTLTVSSDAAPGEYVLTVRGVAGSKEDAAELTLQIVEAPFDFSLSATPPTARVNRGEAASFTITVTLTSGSPNPVSLTLEGLPAGSYSFSPAAVTPTGTSTLTIDTSGLEGTYNIVVKGSWSGVEKTVPITLTVESFDFKISITPATIELKQGETATLIVELELASGTPRPVSLSLTGLPPEASYSFSPQEVTPPGTSTLTISAGPTKGTFTILVKGSGDGVEKTATATVTIKEKLCVIATATYGSELAGEVQLLRGFRDNIVLSTVSGSAFYVAFDAFYYSWSPAVASYIHSHPEVKPIFKAALYPLIGALKVATIIASPLVRLNLELAVYVAGTLASALIGLAYLTPIVYLVSRRKKLGRLRKALLLASVSALLGSLVALTLGLNYALTLFTSAYVVSVMILAPVQLTHYLKRGDG